MRYLNKLVTFSVLIVLLSFLTSCAIPPAEPITVVPPSTPRQISVNGIGEVRVTPDMARVQIGVHTQADTADEALSENNAKTEAVITKLKGMGIDAADIQTSWLNVYPSNQYGPDGTITSNGFIADNTVSVIVRDMPRLGEILDSVVKSGATNINGVEFDLADKTAAVSEARKLAVADARSQAEELAKAANVKVGNIQSIESYTSYPSPVYGVGGGGMVMDRAAAVPIEAGQMSISVSVSVIFEIK